MSELKPTDKGYIEALALEKYPVSENNNIDVVVSNLNKRNGYIQGATDILEHNNVHELIEAVKTFLDKKDFESKLLLIEAVTKAEQNKLNK